MTRFWQTAAIVNAIWAATGEVDEGTLAQVALEVVLLVQLYRAERRGLPHDPVR